jgi:hypothetical protein
MQARQTFCRFQRIAQSVHNPSIHDGLHAGRMLAFIKSISIAKSAVQSLIAAAVSMPCNPVDTQCLLVQEAATQVGHEM